MSSRGYSATSIGSSRSFGSVRHTRSTPTSPSTKSWQRFSGSSRAHGEVALLRSADTLQVLSLELEAGRVEAEPDDERAGVWHVHCADVHPSDTMTIDLAGRLYWCWRMRYRHYDDYFAGQPPLDWSLADT